MNNAIAFINQLRLRRKSIRISIKILLIVSMTVGCSEESPKPFRCYLIESIDLKPRDPQQVQHPNRIVYRYNDQNRVVSRTWIWPSGAKSTQTFQYDSKGNLTSSLSGGFTESYVYDVNNRLIQILQPGSVQPATTYQYNADGQLTSKSSPTIEVAYGYPNKIAKNPTVVTTKYLDSNDSTFYQYEYDHMPNPYKLLWPVEEALDNNITKATYNYQGGSNEYIYVYEYNEHGYPTSRIEKINDLELQKFSLTYECK